MSEYKISTTFKVSFVGSAALLVIGLATNDDVSSMGAVICLVVLQSSIEILDIITSKLDKKEDI